MWKRNAGLLCGLAFVAGQVLAADASVLKTDKDKLSYSIGVSVGKNLKNESPDIDVNLLIEGMKAALAGDKIGRAHV